MDPAGRPYLFPDFADEERRVKAQAHALNKIETQLCEHITSRALDMRTDLEAHVAIPTGLPPALRHALSCPRCVLMCMRTPSMRSTHVHFLASTRPYQSNVSESGSHQ